MNRNFLIAAVMAGHYMAPRSRARASTSTGTGTDAPPQTAAYNVEALKALATATAANSFLYMPEGVSLPLVTAGFAEVNSTIKNEAGEYATRATPAGITVAATLPASQPAPAAAVTDAPKPSATSFTLDDGIALPSARRGGRGASVYPFDGMQPGQSFFVANTKEKPNAAKSLASTISSANARYAEELPGQFETVTVTVYALGADGKRVVGADGHWVKTGEKTEQRVKTKQTRLYVVRAVDETAQGRGPGARIWRQQ